MSRPSCTSQLYRVVASYFLKHRPKLGLKCQRTHVTRSAVQVDSGSSWFSWLWDLVSWSCVLGLGDVTRPLTSLSYSTIPASAFSLLNTSDLLVNWRQRSWWSNHWLLKLALGDAQCHLFAGEGPRVFVWGWEMPVQLKLWDQFHEDKMDR